MPALTPEPVDELELGLVEGFFGTPWPWEERRNAAGFMGELGFGTYLYAPKNDDSFRKHWHAPCPPGHLDALSRLSRHYRDAGLRFGIGLSPYALYRRFDEAGRRQLRAKLGEIDTIAPHTLCLLFDDMPGGDPGLARGQADIMHFVAEHSSARRFMLCPTYYSDDPRLAAHFGPMPANYLDDLGRLLDPAVAIFWTGPKVCSRDYPAAHLRAVAEQLRRKPVLWDNYPVNDSRRMAPFLHLRPFERDPQVLRRHCAGHFVNPMNQARLSRIALQSLAALYRGPAGAGTLSAACATACGEHVGREIAADIAAFQDEGLEAMSAETRARLRRKYQALADNPCAREILDWLDGRYAFDPACLT